MNPADTRLLVHHHDVAFVDETGNIWLSSFIGRWVTVLANHFESVGLLLHESAEHREKQDTCVRKSNVVLHSLGPPGHYWDRLPRMRRIRRTCLRAAEHADGLLIRGYTPRQYTVFTSVKTRHKAFLLVCNPKQRHAIKLSPISIIARVVSAWREREYKKITRSNAVLLANSPELTPEIEAIAGRPAHFVPTNTIHAAEFAPFAVRPLSSPFRLLYVGRLSFRKGIRELFHATAQLHDNGHECVLDIVASRKEPEYSTLVQLAHQLGIADAIRWRGFVPFGPELFEYFRSTDVFVLPSYTEGFPHVLWEAAANCTPVVTTAVGGIPALLKPEEHALLVPPKDAESLAAAVGRLLEEGSLRNHLVESAYALAKAFSIESCAQRLAGTLSQEWK